MSAFCMDKRKGKKGWRSCWIRIEFAEIRPVHPSSTLTFSSRDVIPLRYQMCPVRPSVVLTHTHRYINLRLSFCGGRQAEGR